MFFVAWLLANGLNPTVDEPQEPTPSTEPAPAPEKRSPPTPAENRAWYLKWAGFWLVLVLWFGYDGWYNEDPDMKKHGAFNKSGAFLFAWGCVYCLGQAVRWHIVARRPSQPKQNPPSA